MRLRATLFPIILLVCSYGKAQVKDDFSDGDFTSEYVWSGNTTDFEVDGSSKLHLSAPAETAESFLAVSNSFIDEASWEFVIEMDFNPSSSNQLFVYLVSDQQDLTASLNGYLVRIGNTDDEISLYRQDGISTSKIIDGTDDILDNSSVLVRVKVTRDEAGNWELMRDLTGGTTYVSEGTVLDNTYTSSAYFGFLCDYTSTRSTLFWMDDIQVSKTLDIDSVIIKNNQSIEVVFNQDVTEASSQNIANYDLEDDESNTFNISSAERSDTDQSQVTLTIDQITTDDFQLTVVNVQDSIAEELATNLTFDFSYTQLALSELLTLSGSEIELTFNDDLDATTAESITNYSIDNGIGQPLTATVDPNNASKVSLILENELFESTTFQLSVSGIANEAENSAFAGTEDFTFIIPLVLDTIEATSASTCIVRFNKSLDESIAETTANYSLDGGVGNPTSATLQSDEKSIVLSFDSNFSDGENTLTINNLEDTDGNEIDTESEESFDYLHLTIESLNQEGDLSVKVTFNQNVGETSSETLANYTLSEIGQPTGAIRSDTDLDEVILTFERLYNSAYELCISDVSNEPGNSTPNDLSDSVDVSKATEESHLIITEFLADPTPSIGLPEVEYVEIYNTLDYSVELNGFTLDGQTISSYLLEGKSYVVLTDDGSTGSFSISNIVGVSSMGALTNSADAIVLKDQLGNQIDSINYDASDWYDDDAKDDGGYSLELIDPLQPCSDASNWTGSTNASGGTPGEQNSVFNAVDDTSPSLVSVDVMGGDSLKLSFSEPIDESTISVSSFTLSGYAFSQLIKVDFQTYFLVLSSDLTSEINYSLEAESISDCRGNELTSQTFDFYYDIKPPSLEYVAFISDQELALVFDEPLQESVAEDEDLFMVGGLNVDRSLLQDSAAYRVQVTFEESFELGQSYTLTYNALEDTLGNALPSSTYDFTFQSVIDSAYTETANVLVLSFSETLADGLITTNYLLEDSEMNPQEVVQDENDARLFRLLFKDNFDAGDEQILYVSNLFNESATNRLPTPAATFVYDISAPSVEELQVKNDSQLVVLFSEAFAQSTALVSANYQLENDEQPIDVEVLTASSVALTFQNKFPQEVEKTLSISGIDDQKGNKMSSTRNVDFIYDTRAPQLERAVQWSLTQVMLTFSEKLERTSATTLTNYQLVATAPISAQILGPDSVDVLLTFLSIPEQENNDFTIDNIEDQNGNQGDEITVDFNGLNPAIVDLKGKNDSTVTVRFSQPVANATEIANYELVGFEIQNVVSSSAYEYDIEVAGQVEDAGQLQLSVTNVLGDNGVQLQTNNFSAKFETYLKTFNLINERSIYLDFTTDFSSVSKSSFGIDDHAISLASIDGDHRNVIRLTLNIPLTSDELITLSWAGLEDAYERVLPDYSIQLVNDKTAPLVNDIASDFYSKLQVTFSEPMDNPGLKSITKYLIIDVGLPGSLLIQNDSLVQLDFNDQLQEGNTYELIVYPISDISGNQLVQDTISFTYQPPALLSYKQIVINELMPDPSPAVALPQVEYIELYNASSDSFDLRGLLISDSGDEIKLPNYVLDGKSYVLIVDADNIEMFSSNNIIGLDGLFALSNGGETIRLETVTGDLVDSLTYDLSWYGGDNNDGGYALELIDPFGSCPNVLNWSASINENGGTPGLENSVYRIGEDEVSPVIEEFVINSTSSFSIQFNEAMDSISLTNLNLSISDFSIAERIVSGTYSDYLTANLSESLPLGQYYELNVTGATDCSGTALADTVITFGLGREPLPGDLVITEIMADPDPTVELPNAEYVEIFNTTDDLIALDSVRFRDANSSRLIGNHVLSAGSYVILTAATDAALFASYGEVIGLSDWPSLTNSGEELTLATSETIDQVTYDSDWFTDSEKKAGGYSLEMINLSGGCTGAYNWSASTNENGGTPGLENSVYRIGEDEVSPVIEEFVINSTSSFTLQFNEAMDSVSLTNLNLSISGYSIAERIVSGTYSDYLTANLSESLPPGQYYELNVSGATDCSGTALADTVITFGLGREPLPGELAITEIMADPDPTVELPNAEYVEIFNTTDDLIALDSVRFRDASSSRLIGNYVLSAGSYVILTAATDAALFASYGEVIGLSDWPSLTNSGEELTLATSETIDQVTYDSDWFTDSEKKAGGYSLEMINLSGGCTGAYNWSASTNENGGTPGLENSVYRIGEDEVSPVIEEFVINSTSSFTLQFNEAMDSVSLTNLNLSISGYSIAERIVSGTYSDYLTANLSESLPPGQYYELNVSGATDCSGTALAYTVITFGLGREPLPGELAITEIMADPDPTVELPNAEYVEIFNTTDDLIALDSVRFRDASSSRLIGNYVLSAGSYVILTAATDAALFASYGEVIGLSDWPSLTNSGEELTLATSETIDQVTYDSDWFTDSEKKAGGYSLEMINLSGGCADAFNWDGSNDVSGGTPGKQNSLYNDGPDSDKPVITSFEVYDDHQTLFFVFNESMDSASLINATILISGYSFISRSVSGEANEELTVTLNQSLDAGAYYDLLLRGADDCSGAQIADTTITFGLGRKPLPGELIFTEIMADPDPAVELPNAEYVEIFNTTDDLISLKDVRFRDSNSSRLIGDFIIPDSSYVILTSSNDASPFKSFGHVIGLSTWPALTNSGEMISLATDQVIDQITYDSDWFSNPEKKSGGYSLEIINPTGACSGISNWDGSNDKSGGTPGRVNSIYNEGPDSDLPTVAMFEVIDDQTLKFTFNESMDSLSLITANIEGVVVAMDRLVSGEGFRELTVGLVVPLQKDEVVEISISLARDCSGNVMTPASFEVAIGTPPLFNDLVISEIMSDPDPAVELPSAEYLELYNRSTNLISLDGVSLIDQTDSVSLPSVTMKPGDYLLLTTTSSVSDFDEVIMKAGVPGWSALNNGGELLTLMHAGEIIFQVDYDQDWHNENAQAGGVSLEMKDLNNPCGGSENWASSRSSTGGTPGTINASTESIPDNFGPHLVSARAINTRTLELVFDETLRDRTPDNLVLSFDPVNIVQTTTFGIDRRTLIVYLGVDLEVNVPVHLEVFGVTDCLGNSIQAGKITLVLPDEGAAGDLVFNELLFNPRSEGVDFIELANISEKYIDLVGWQLGRVEDESIDFEVMEGHFVLGPGEFVAITTDSSVIKNQYPQGMKQLWQVNQLPPMSNAEGTVVLANPTGEILDQFEYNEDFHLSFLESVDGVSLERIDPNTDTQNPNNWTSASSAVGYATPGYINTQAFETSLATAQVTVEPKVFVPGNRSAAHQSFTTINYNLDKSGQFANITVYNQLGQPVADLGKGISLGASGFIRWDGTSYGGSVVRRGYYVVLFEVYDSSGNSQLIKETVVVGM